MEGDLGCSQVVPYVNHDEKVCAGKEGGDLRFSQNVLYANHDEEKVCVGKEGDRRAIWGVVKSYRTSTTMRKYIWEKRRIRG